MTTYEVAAAMRRFADILDKLPEHLAFKTKPMLTEEMQLGGLFTLNYLISMITEGNRDVYDRPTLLVLLDICTKDPEMFQQGLHNQVKLAFDEGEEERCQSGY